MWRSCVTALGLFPRIGGILLLAKEFFLWKKMWKLAVIDLAAKNQGNLALRSSTRKHACNLLVFQHVMSAPPVRAAGYDPGSGTAQGSSVSESFAQFWGSIAGGLTARAGHGYSAGIETTVRASDLMTRDRPSTNPFRGRR